MDNITNKNEKSLSVCYFKMLTKKKYVKFLKTG